MICPICKCNFYRPNNQPNKIYCSRQCAGVNRGKYTKKRGISKRKQYKDNPSICKECKSTLPWLKSRNIFCNSSCAASYNNKNKKHGFNSSQLEKYLQKELTKNYPNLDFCFNDRTLLGLELDIYLPYLHLAFEINGIVHYDPIYGHNKLKRIQNNDEQKLDECLHKGIELITIDTRAQHRFSEISSQEFLNIISNTINNQSY